MFVEIWITLGHFANLVEIWITQSIYKPLSPGLASPYLSFLESGGDYVFLIIIMIVRMSTLELHKQKYVGGFNLSNHKN